MQKKMMRIAEMLIAFILLGIIAYAISRHYQAARSYKGLLSHVVSSADRIEIQTSSYWHDNYGKLLHEINGRKKAKQLLKLMKFDEGKFNPPCACGGDYWIAFFEGQKELATLEVHEPDRLRWHYGKWPGDVDLTKESSKAVEDWLKAEGFDFKYIPEEYRSE
jgi:hypothetical protein